MDVGENTCCVKTWLFVVPMTTVACPERLMEMIGEEGTPSPTICQRLPEGLPVN
jgi:hypothetical protein